MDTEALKTDLQKIEYKNLSINDGSSAEKFKKIERKFKIPETSKIIAFINDDLDDSLNSGVVITEDGLKWDGIVKTQVNGKETYNGFIAFKELASFNCSVKKKFIRLGVELENMNIKNGSYTDIELAFKYDVEFEPDENQLQIEIDKLQKVFITLINVTKNESSIPDECNGELITTFIGDKDSARFYKKAFAKYNINGVDKFTFVFSFGGLCFGIFNLFHRRLYKESLIWFLISILPVGLSGGILYIASAFAGAFVNPYLVYKKFKRTLVQCNSHGMTYEEKLETLKSVGGTNGFTTFLIGIVGLIVGIGIILLFIRSCFG